MIPDFRLASPLLDFTTCQIHAEASFHFGSSLLYDTRMSNTVASSNLLYIDRFFGGACLLLFWVLTSEVAHYVFMLNLFGVSESPHSIM